MITIIVIGMITINTLISGRVLLFEGVCLSICVCVFLFYFLF